MPRTPFTQLIFTCSKATIETLGKGVKYFKINNNKDTRTTPFIFIVNFVMSLLLTLNVFYTFFSVSIADFEQVNVSWKFNEEEMGEDAVRHHLVHRFNQPSALNMPGTQVPMYAQPCIELLTLERLNGEQKRKAQQLRKKRWRSAKIKVFNLLERPRTKISLFYHTFVFFLILASLLLSVLITISRFENDTSIQEGVYYLEVSLLAVFTIEYILRIWSCSCHGNYKGFWGKLRFIRKPYMVIDIIVIVATAIVLATTSQDGDRNDHFNVSMFRFLRFLQVLRILRLDRQRGAFKIVSQIFYEHRQELLTCWYMSFILVVACSFLVYLAEKSDDQETEKEDGELNDLGEGLYFGMITLLTVGYGDFSPKNWMAKIITCLFSFIGTAFFALPAGILGSGFALQVAQNQKQKHFNRRRIPAAVTIQYAWRLFAASPSFRSSATWKPHQISSLASYNKKYSTYTRGGSPAPGSPQTGRKSMTYFMRKLQNNKAYGDGDSMGPMRSSIGATIPSAIELRDNRSHSEGNLLLIGSDNLDDNQATIVSLPPTMMSDGTESLIKGKNYPGLNGYASTQDVRLKPLMESEKTALRFIRKVKLYIAIRKFKEERRPYDVKDVIEQYTEGQMDMFGFIKKFQYRVESALGVQDDSMDQGKSVKTRLCTVEKKVDDISEKLDKVLSILSDHQCPHYTRQRRESRSMGASPLIRRKNCFVGSGPNLEHDYPESELSVKTGDVFTEDYIDNDDGTVEPEELKRRIELLKQESEYNGSRGSLDSRGSGISREAEPRRSDSRFTVTPTVLITDMTGKIIKKNLPTKTQDKESGDDSLNTNLSNEDKDKKGVSTSSRNSRVKSNMQKSVSFPNIIDEPSDCKPHRASSDNSDLSANSQRLTKLIESKNNEDQKTKCKRAQAPHSLSKLFPTSEEQPEKTDEPVLSTHHNETDNSSSEQNKPNKGHENNSATKNENEVEHMVSGEHSDVIVNPSFDMKC